MTAIALRHSGLTLSYVATKRSQRAGQWLRFVRLTLSRRRLRQFARNLVTSSQMSLPEYERPGLDLRPSLHASR